MKSKWENEKENLKKLILEDNLSYEEIGRKYNCSGGNIKKVAIRLGIELPVRRKINSIENFNKGVIRAKLVKCLNCGKKFPLYYGSYGKTAQ